MLGAIKQMHNAARVCCAEAPHVMLSSVCAHSRPECASKRVLSVSLGCQSAR